MQSQSPSTQKAKYGIDAPGVIRNLFLAAAGLALIAIFCPPIKIGSVVVDVSGLIWSAFGCALGGALMLFYSLYGKFKHRDRMLNLINWRGDEQALDIGTGQGLLMIGAAKQVSTGKSTGIDIWNAEDLSGNMAAAALNNAAIEGVADRVAVINQNATAMTFADGSFDVIVTNMCLHNIYNKEGRMTACREIARVLKDNGTAVISDFRHMGEYKRNFDQLGLHTKLSRFSYVTYIPPVGILVLKKAIL